MHHGGYETVQREWIHDRISVNHEYIFVECGVDTNDILDLMIHLQLKWIHWRPEVNLWRYVSCIFCTNLRRAHPVQEMHQSHLRVPLSAIARPLSLRWLSNLHQYNIRHDMSRTLVQTTINFAHIVLLGTLTK